MEIHMKPILPAALAISLAVAMPSSADVVLINAFEVPESKRAAVIAAWEDARAFLSTQPGYIDTALHGAITPNARFELVNIARWESAEAFMAATTAMRASGVFVPPDGTVANPALYTIVRAN